jgi:hypothetical protein
MYGFEVSGKGTVEENRKKVGKLKDGFVFVYRVNAFNIYMISLLITQ